MTAQAQLKTTVKSAVSASIPGSWRRHPGVRTGEQLTRGERAADSMRNSMGSWMFVFVAVPFLAVWMMINVGARHSDRPHLRRLSVHPAQPGAVLRGGAPGRDTADRRQAPLDQVASELAQHDYEADTQSREMLEVLTEEFATLRTQHAEQSQQLAELIGRLAKE